MAGMNGHGNDHEDRISKLEAARKEIEDTLVVMAHLEKNAAARVKEHAQFIAEQQALLDAHTRQLEEERVARKALDARVDRLVSSIGELIARIPPSSLAL